MTQEGVRAARAADVPALTALLVRAFAADDFLGWVYLGPEHQPRLHARLTAAVLRHQYLPGGGIELAETAEGHLLGGAVWAPPHAPGLARWRMLPVVPVLLATLGPRRFAEFARRGRAVEHALGAARPREPHWYLSLLAADPTRQRAGVGGALLRSRLTGLRRPAYLECVPANIGYYQRFGFTVTERLALPAQAPPLFGMRRQPS